MDRISALLISDSAHKPTPLSEMHGFQGEEVSSERDRISKSIYLVHYTRGLNTIGHSLSIINTHFILQGHLQQATGS